MLMPSIFGEDMFDDFMRDFPFFDENAGNKIEKKLYGRHAKNMMKTDIKELEGGYELEMDLPGFTKDEILSLIHISEPTRLDVISYAVFCLKKIFF